MSNPWAWNAQSPEPWNRVWGMRAWAVLRIAVGVCSKAALLPFWQPHQTCNLNLCQNPWEDKIEARKNHFHLAVFQNTHQYTPKAQFSHHGAYIVVEKCHEARWEDSGLAITLNRTTYSHGYTILLIDRLFNCLLNLFMLLLESCIYQLSKSQENPTLNPKTRKP